MNVSEIKDAVAESIGHAQSATIDAHYEHGYKVVKVAVIMERWTDGKIAIRHIHADGSDSDPMRAGL